MIVFKPLLGRSHGNPGNHIPETTTLTVCIVITQKATLKPTQGSGLFPRRDFETQHHFQATLSSWNLTTGSHPLPSLRRRRGTGQRQPKAVCLKKYFSFQGRNTQDRVNTGKLQRNSVKYLEGVVFSTSIITQENKAITVTTTCILFTLVCVVLGIRRMVSSTKHRLF